MSRRFNINAPRNSNQKYHNNNIYRINTPQTNDAIDEEDVENTENSTNNPNQTKQTPELRIANIKNVELRMPKAIKINLLAIAIIAFFFVFLLIYVSILSGNNIDTGSSSGLGGYPYFEGACDQVSINGEIKSIEDYVLELTITQASDITSTNGEVPNETIKELAVTTRTFIVNHGKEIDSNDDKCTYDVSDKSIFTIEGTDDEALKEKYEPIVKATKGVIIVDGNDANEITDKKTCIYDGKNKEDQSNAKNMSLTYDDTQEDNKSKNNTGVIKIVDNNIFQNDYYYIEYHSKNNSDNNYQEISKEKINNIGGFLGQYLMNIFNTTNVCIIDKKNLYGISKPGSIYLEKIDNYDWKSIIKYYHDDSIELMSIYKGLSYSGDYPINPDDELYQGLSFFIDDISFSDFLAQKGTSIEEYNNHLQSSIESAGVGTREGVVTAAMTLIGSLAEMGVKFNYQWGGKYHNVGIRPDWGLKADLSWMENICSSYVKLYGNHDHCVNDYRWNSFDCSGFVNWAITNGMQKKVENVMTGSGGETLNSEYAVCKPGGVLVGSGHIVLVVETDDASKRYIIAESTGSDIYAGYGGVKLSYYGYGSPGYECDNLNYLYGD